MDVARQILDQLYRQQRPDWKDSLYYWDHELAKVGIARPTSAMSTHPSILPLSLIGPLWTHDDSPFASVLPAKSETARKILVFGNTVLAANRASEPMVQPSDTPGRLSRVIPLTLAERVYLQSDAIGSSMILWAQGQGFAVFGAAYPDLEMREIAKKCDPSPDFIVGVIVDATQPELKLLLRLLSVTDGVCVAEAQRNADATNPGPAVEMLAQELQQLLVKYADVHLTLPPRWYQVPAGSEFSDYLLRLEQQLVVMCAHLHFLEGGELTW